MVPSRGELLELMHDAGTRWRTVQAVFTYRLAGASLTEALQRATGRTDDASRHGDVEIVYGLNAATDPFRMRLELRSSHGSATPPPELVVDDGQVLWERRDGRVVRSVVRLAHPMLLRAPGGMLLPRALSADWRLTLHGVDACDGRLVWRLRAEPMPGHLPPTGVLYRPDAMAGDLVVDTASGIVLSARWQGGSGRVIESAELSDLMLDGPVAAPVFTLEHDPEARVYQGPVGLPARFAPAASSGC